jgi:hypothetical protein
MEFLSRGDDVVLRRYKGTKNKSTRDLIYVNGQDMDTQYFYSYGIEFNEFMSSVPHRPEHLILLKHNFEQVQINPHSRLEYVTSEGIDTLMNEDVYDYGDFCWVDFNNEEEHTKLTGTQIEEMLHFADTSFPLHEIPKERFAYFAHDDGWFNKIYVTYLEEYQVMLSQVIVLKVHRLMGRFVDNIPCEISSKLLQYTREGLFMDFAKITKNKHELKIPVALIGCSTNMDKVYDHRDVLAEYNMWLVHTRNGWSFTNGTC